jgi:hypothetical protein
MRMTSRTRGNACAGQIRLVEGVNRHSGRKAAGYTRGLRLGDTIELALSAQVRLEFCEHHANVEEDFAAAVLVSIASAPGPRLTTWVSRLVVSYLGYTGGDAGIVAGAALDP